MRACQCDFYDFQMVSWLPFSSLLPICYQTDNLGNLFDCLPGGQIDFLLLLPSAWWLLKEQLYLCAWSLCLFWWKKFHEMHISLQLSKWSYSSFTCLLLVIWFPFSNSRHTLLLLHQHLYVIHGYQGLEKSMHSFSPCRRESTESDVGLMECVLFPMVTWERSRSRGSPLTLSHLPANHKPGVFLYSSGDGADNGTESQDGLGLG